MIKILYDNKIQKKKRRKKEKEKGEKGVNERKEEDILRGGLNMKGRKGLTFRCASTGLTRFLNRPRD